MNIYKSKKSFLITLMIFMFGTNILFAQSNVDFANKYYDLDDYQTAVDYFKKTLFEDKVYDGTILYRYAYSMEQIDAPKKEYLPFYSAAAYCFETTNKTDEKYYFYAIAKEESYILSHKNYSKETIEKLLQGEKVRNQNFIIAILDELPENSLLFMLIFYCIAVVVIYIIGRKFSQNTECVIFSSKKEIFFLFSPFFILLALFVNSESSELFGYIFLGSLIISFISAIIFSIFDNIKTKRPALYITISLLTKLVLFIISPIVLFLTLCVLKDEKKDGRFRDGTKNNQKTKNIALIMLVLTSLIFSLIKTPRRKIEVKQEA